MNSILLILMLALAQPPASAQADKRPDSRSRSIAASACSYLRASAACDGVSFRLVGVVRPAPSATSPGDSGEVDEAARLTDDDVTQARSIGPLAVSVSSAAIEKWTLSVRVPLRHEPTLPGLAPRSGAACGPEAPSQAPVPPAQASVMFDGELDAAMVPELDEAARHAASLHDRAIQGLAIASAIAAARASGSSVDGSMTEQSLTALERAGSSWLAEPTPEESILTVISTDAMGLVATIEYWDARQALSGALSKPNDAALARETLRWHLRRLGATRLVGLLDERVPSVGTGFLSLTACPAWPADAWEIVEKEQDLCMGRDALRARLQEITERAARRFDDEYAAMLRKAMGFVERSIPVGLSADERLLREIEQFLSRPLDEEASIRIGMSPEGIALTRNDGNAELTTRAWEVWGRLLATGGIPPAEESRRQSQIDGWYEMAAQRALRWDTTGRVAQGGLDAMAGAFEALMSDPWSGWAFRAMPERVYEHAMRKARGSLGLALDGTPSGDENGLRDALRISAWETHLELQRAGLTGGELRALSPFPMHRTLDAGHGMAISNAPARRRLMLDPYGMYPSGAEPRAR